MPLSSTTILEKSVAEVILAGMSFSNWLASGETISTIVSVANEACDGASDLTFSSEAISGSNINFLIAGGTAGIRYNVIVTITTSLGQTLQGEGILVVK